MKSEQKMTTEQLNEIDGAFSFFGTMESTMHYLADNKRNLTYIWQGDSKQADEIARNEKAYMSNQIQGMRTALLKKVPNNGWLGKLVHNIA